MLHQIVKQFDQGGSYGKESDQCHEKSRKARESRRDCQGAWRGEQRGIKGVPGAQEARQDRVTQKMLLFAERIGPNNEPIRFVKYPGQMELTTQNRTGGFNEFQFRG